VSKSETGLRNFNRDEEEFLHDFEVSADEMRTRHEQCPSPELILGAGSDVLPDEISRKSARHLETCPSCAALGRDMADPEIADPNIDEQARIKERIDKESKTQKAAFGWGWLWSRVLPASVVVVALVGAVLWYGRQHASPSQNRTATAPRTGPLPMESVFKLEKPPIRLPASSLLWRGGKQKYERDLANALEPYDRDNFGEAASRLQQLTKRYPDSAVAHFYLGISEIFLNRDADAIEELKKAQSLHEELLDREMHWYLALAYQRTGDRVNAVAELENLCGNPGAYSAQACAGSQELRGGTH